MICIGSFIPRKTRLQIVISSGEQLQKEIRGQRISLWLKIQERCYK
ncbi:hypothetical protein Pint_00209 [Pistacia integerrima]|uniref:Uncharacterized protein n=1 Tax=Pistacia integerrima TaxID=434235 RepID=A0ACC0ZNK6_9ROSI|nr:hypothetical protein Pint_00209 [Pistacia integerrima]